MGTGKIVELLAPAKDYAHGCAAIDCGADALYVGAPAFGARAGAAVPGAALGRRPTRSAGCAITPTVSGPRSSSR